MRIASIQAMGIATLWIMGIVGLLLLGQCTLQPALAHTEIILKCDKNLPISKAVPIGDPVQYQNGLIGERYDRNDDGQVDIEVLSIPVDTDETANPVTGTYKFTHKRFPLFYVVDLDFDGEPDAVYIDRTPDGVNVPEAHCDNVVLYEDLKKQRPTEDRTPDYQKRNDL